MACAGQKADTTPAGLAARAATQADVAQLRAALAERDRAVDQLESRLALLEAEQRQLRYAVAEAEAVPVGIRETVRIGADASRSTGERPSMFEPEAEPERRRPESRPILRLTGERRRENAEPLMPIPVVTERLPIAPLPENVSMLSPPPAPDAGNLYRQAIELVRQREFGVALASLTDFLARFPADERAPKVMFWRGEVLFAQREYGRALEAFESSLAREPKGDRAADALLKVGLCHKRLGAPDRARAAIERLKAQFPQSDAARLAAQEDA